MSGFKKKCIFFTILIYMYLDKFLGAFFRGRGGGAKWGWRFISAVLVRGPPPLLRKTTLYKQHMCLHFKIWYLMIFLSYLDHWYCLSIKNILARILSSEIFQSVFFIVRSLIKYKNRILRPISKRRKNEKKPRCCKILFNF